jgi:hypothetical protein
MRRIANGLFAIAASLNRVANALETKNTVILPNNVSTTSTNPYIVKKTETSNPGYEKGKISLQQKMPTQLESIASQIYKALSDKGSHPDHHEHVMREMKTKWPVLFTALDRLEKYYIYNIPKHYRSSKQNIWREIQKDDKQI